MDMVERVCTAYAWQRALGHHTMRDPLCCLVWDHAHPDVWDANHVSEVRARTEADVDQVLQRVAETFGHCRHRLFVVDPLTPAAFVARLALDDYRELTPTIQLVLEGPLRAHPRDLDLRPVTTEADWQCLYALVRHNHTEGESPHGAEDRLMAKKKFQRMVRPATAEERQRHAAIRHKVQQEFPPAAGAHRHEAPPGIPAQIRRAREAKGLTWYTVAKLAGIPNPNTVRDIEYGRDAKLSNVQSVAKALGLRLELVQASG